MNKRLQNKKILGVLGGGGMLGSDLVNFLSEYFEVHAIEYGNYEEKKAIRYNILVNANGNSKRFWANQNPLADFDKSTISVYRSMFDFSADFYIYISSPNVYADPSSPESTKEDKLFLSDKIPPYGFNKRLSELIVQRYAKKYLILRSALILGRNLRKGPIYDIMHGDNLFVTLDSRLQMITTEEIAKIIHFLIDQSIENNIYNMGGQGTFLLNEMKIENKEKRVSVGAETQVYEMNVEKLKAIYPLKDSKEYLKSYLSSNGLNPKTYNL